MKRMNTYTIKSFVECGLYFKTIQSAKTFADKHHLKVCEVYYQNGNIKTFIGYGIENEEGLMTGKEFISV